MRQRGLRVEGDRAAVALFRLRRVPVLRRTGSKSRIAEGVGSAGIELQGMLGLDARPAQTEGAVNAAASRVNAKVAVGKALVDRRLGRVSVPAAPAGSVGAEARARAAISATEPRFRR